MLQYILGSHPWLMDIALFLMGLLMDLIRINNNPPLL